MNDRPAVDVTAYLERIGAAADWPLAELQRAHLLTVPFENLSIHLGEPISLEPHALAEKILGRRRGGFCYELNGLFAQLLTALGHSVELLSARVHTGHGWGPPLDHLALGVGNLVVDVGFGAHSTLPLRRDISGEQVDEAGVFEVLPAPWGQWEVRRDGLPRYLLSPHPYELRDFEAMCWWQSHAPGLTFTTSLVCTRLTEHGRATISGRRLIETVDGVREERVLVSDAEVLAVYRDRFGVELDRVPAVRPPGGSAQ